jgi:hypothetical protein
MILNAAGYYFARRIRSGDLVAGVKRIAFAITALLCGLQGIYLAIDPEGKLQ